MKKFLGFTLTAALLLPAYDANAVEELSMQSNYQQAHVQMGKNLIPDAEKIFNDSNGELKINVYSNGAIAPANEVLLALQNGLVDMIAGAGPADIPAQYPMAGILASMPGLASSAHQAVDLYWKIYDTVPEFKAELDKAGKILALWSTPVNAISSVNGPIRSPADVKGKKVLFCVPSSKGHIESWGGIPVQVSPSEIYTGLQRGMGEAFTAPLPFQRGAGLQEVAKYVTLIPTGPNMQVLAINQDIFDSLPTDQQKLISNMYGDRAYSYKLADTLDQDVKDGCKIFEAAGCKVINLSEEETKTFIDALITPERMEAYWLPLMKKNNLKGEPQEWIKKIYAIADEVKAAK